jgi:ribosome-associated protein
LNFDIVKKIYNLLDDKKAMDIVVLKVNRITTVADYFIIATGTSSTHINALCDHVEKTLFDAHISPKHKEGRAKGEWVLMDYQDFVVHIFNAEMRAYYNLERIWSDAEFITIV